MNSHSFFSIVIPLYNKEKYIARAIDSVLLQKNQNFELIVVDDGSTDGGAAIVVAYDDKRIRLISQKNQGVSAARNAGIAASGNDWVAFLDADDMWLPDHLVELSRIALLFPEAGMISASIMNLTGELKSPSFTPVNAKHAISEINYFLSASKKIGIVNSSSVCIKKNVLNAVGGFSKYLRGEDLELWARVALYYKVAISEKVTSIYFTGTGGVMSSGEYSANPFRPGGSLKVSDFSPSSSFLIKELLRGSIAKDKIPDVTLYINSRISSHVRGCVIRGEFEKAKKISRFYISPCNKTDTFLKKIANSPLIFVGSIWFFRLILRKIYRFFWSIKK